MNTSSGLQSLGTSPSLATTNPGLAFDFRTSTNIFVISLSLSSHQHPIGKSTQSVNGNNVVHIDPDQVKEPDGHQRKNIKSGKCRDRYLSLGLTNRAS